MSTIDTQDVPSSGLPHEGIANAPANRATFEVAGEPYQPAGDAARAMLDAAPDITPSGAYGRLRRAAAAGMVRTIPVNRGHSWYHRDDVLALADQVRGT